MSKRVTIILKPQSENVPANPSAKPAIGGKITQLGKDQNGNLVFRVPEEFQEAFKTYASGIGHETNPELTSVIVTAKAETIKSFVANKSFPNISEAFQDVARISLIGKDHHHSARFTVPVDGKEDIVTSLSERGYMVEDDYDLTIGSRPRPF